MHRLALGAAFGALTVVACGPAPQDARTAGPADRPEALSAALFDMAGVCSVAGGTPHTDDAVRRADLTGDGLDDFVLYAGWIVCEHAASVYGDREKTLRVFAAGGDGAGAEPFADATFDVRLEPAAAGARLWLTTSGEQCGRPPAATFAEESFCERAVEWDPGRRQFAYAPVATVRMIQ